jgi:hypothetical protein
MADAQRHAAVSGHECSAAADRDQNDKGRRQPETPTFATRRAAAGGEPTPWPPVAGATPGRRPTAGSPGLRGVVSGGGPGRGEDANTARNDAARSAADRSEAVRWFGTSAGSVGVPSNKLSSAARGSDGRSLAIFGH